MIEGNPHNPNITKTHKRKCSICGIEGHNKIFHPDGNPKAKIGIARSSKKSAVAKSKRNVGEIDDKRYQLDIADGSDEEEDHSDDEEDTVWGI